MRSQIDGPCYRGRCQLPESCNATRETQKNENLREHFRFFSTPSQLVENLINIIDQRVIIETDYRGTKMKKYESEDKPQVMRQMWPKKKE